MIKGELIGTEATIAKTRRWAPNLRGEVAQAIGRLVLMLQRNVKADKLSGQVLRVRTGRLRRSINTRLEGMDGTKPTGYVGTNVSYARPHEFGFTGRINVRAHLRTIKQAFGKSIEPVAVQVGGYSRQVVLPERSFLRTGLADLGPTIQTELQTAVGRAVK